MEELKVPVFESYLELQETAKEEAHYLNSVIAPQLIKKGIKLTLEILAEASENPEEYGLEDSNKNKLKPFKVTSRKYLAFEGSVIFLERVFESWYHSIHPDGIKRAKFFRGLKEKDRKLLKYYEEEN